MVTDHEQSTPDRAGGAQVRRDGEKWEPRHSPGKVWQALTGAAQLQERAPFEADGNLGTPKPHVTETRAVRAGARKVLEYGWVGNDMRWELEALDGGTRRMLWTNLDRPFISMAAAGWHICLDVLDRRLSGTPTGRIAGGEALKSGGWQLERRSR